MDAILQARWLAVLTGWIAEGQDGPTTLCVPVAELTSVSALTDLVAEGGYVHTQVGSYLTIARPAAEED